MGIFSGAPGWRNDAAPVARAAGLYQGPSPGSVFVAQFIGYMRKETREVIARRSHLSHTPDCFDYDLQHLR
jgi:hypothetical protein